MKFKEYIQIANLLKNIRVILDKEPQTIRKNCVSEKRRIRVNKAMCELQSNLEEMMFTECATELFQLCRNTFPDCDTHIFYNVDERLNPDEMKWEKPKK